MHPIEPEELMAYLDGELPPQRASIAGDHLSHCLDCQLAAAEMQDVSRRLLEWQIEEPAPRVEQAVNSARRRKKLRPAWRRGVPWIAALAAACLLIVLFVSDRYLAERSERQASQRRLTGRGDPTGAGWSAGAARSCGYSFAGLRAGSAGRAVAATAIRIPDGIDPRTSRHSDCANLPAPRPTSPGRAPRSKIFQRHGGHIGALHIESPADTGQTLQATLRIPARQLDAAITEIRQIGRVETEQQAGQEVSRQTVDSRSPPGQFSKRRTAARGYLVAAARAKPPTSWPSRGKSIASAAT